MSQSVCLVPDDEYQLVVLDSVGDGMCCGYGDGSATLYQLTVDDSNVLITSSNGRLVMSSTKSIPNSSCIVSRMTFTIADSARATIILILYL